jgi:PAS domain S-box-containing protein
MGELKMLKKIFSNRIRCFLRNLRVKTLLVFIASVWCLAGFMSPALGAEPQRVLVLNSYHKGYAWTDKLIKGIETVMSTSEIPIDIHIEYMDTKRISDEKHYKNLFELYKHKLVPRKFDIIISSDDNAFRFLLKYRSKLFPGIPIVFCGLNRFTDSMLVGQDDITGVVEGIDFKATIDLALQLQPNVKNVVVVTDDTKTGINLAKGMRKIIPQMKDRVNFSFLLMTDLTMQELLDKLNGLENDSIMIPLGQYRDKAGNVYSLKESMALITKKCNVPIYVLQDIKLGYGTLGGKVVSGFAQGEMAAQMALRILNGESPGNIPIVRKSPNRYMLDHQQLVRHGIKLSDLPNGSIILNKPFSFYETYKPLIWTAVAVIVVLLLLVFFLSWNIVYRKRTQDALRQSEERYRSLVENQTDLISRFTPDGTFIFVNDAFCHFSEKTKNELIGKKWQPLPVSNDLPFVQEKLEALSPSNQTVLIENRILSGKGDIHWMQFVNSGLFDFDGNLVEIHSVGRDITDRKQAEQDLLKERSLLKTIIDNIPVMLTHYNPDAKMIYLNKEFEKIVGWKTEEVQDIDMMEKVYPDPDYRQQAVEYMQQASTEWREFRVQSKSGKIIDSEWSNICMEDGTQIGIGINITERKQAEEELRNSNATLELAQKMAGLGYWSYDIETEMPTWSQEMYVVFGLDPEQGQPSYEDHKKTWHPDDWDMFDQAVQDAIQLGKSYNIVIRIIFPDHSIHYVNTQGYPRYDENGRITELYGTSQDITERMGKEEAIRESEDKFRSFAEQSLVGIYLISGDHFKYVNPKFAEIFGYSVDECLDNMHFPQLVHPEDLATVEKQVGRRLSGETKPVRYSFRGIKKSGETIHVEIFGSSMVLKGKTVATGTMLDITESKRAQEALLNQTYFLQKAQEIGQIGTWELDIKKNELLWTDENYRIFGLPIESKLTYEIFLNCVHPDDREYVDTEWKAAFDKKPYDIEHRLLVDGKVKWVREKAELQFNEKDECIRGTGFSQDINDRKQAEEEKKKLETKLQRAQKMEAMGLMAGGVAHDLNNILSGIVSYPELLLMDLPEDSPLRKPIKTIQESGQRAADVVEDLLTIARGVASGKEILNLNTMVEEYLDSAEHQKLERIHPLSTFKTELDSDLLNITGSASHVKKVLMNLIVNASEAIEDKGTVIVSTMNRYLDEPLKGYEDVRTGEYILLGVSDEGSGISPQDLDRIFEPFYTKKVMGRSGTGLGLAVVWNTVQDHNGYINVNTSDKGTAFELYFPVTREQVADEKEKTPLENYLGHGEKILVVDDEERQREIASGILTRLGYNAEAVSSGEDAIEYVKTNPVDLILLDMVMPKGINGRKTYEEIIKIHPGQKAIIASGYTRTKEVDAAQELGAGKYIKKPYTLAKVGVAVKEELEK